MIINDNNNNNTDNESNQSVSGFCPFAIISCDAFLDLLGRSYPTKHKFQPKTFFRVVFGVDLERTSGRSQKNIVNR